MHQFKTLALLLTATLITGCSFELSLSSDDFQGEADAVVSTAFAASADSEGTAPDDDEPEVGDKCPDCNDPPGACGVGRVGDGRICRECARCGGDGRIDRDDLELKIGTMVPTEPFADSLPDRITLHLDASHASTWKNWWEEERPKYLEQGVEVLIQQEPEGSGVWLMFDDARVETSDVTNMESSSNEIRRTFLDVFATL